MIPLARRYSGAALTLLAIALLAVALHAVLAARFDPCPDPAQLLRLDAYGHDYEISEHEGTGDTHPQHRVDGTLPPVAPGARPLAFRVSRSEEPYPIYTQSYLIVPRLPEDRLSLRELRVGPDVLPVYRLFDDSLGAIRFTRFFLVLGATPVAHPLASGMASAWQQLVGGTVPVTAFVVTGVAPDAEKLIPLEKAAEAWLSAAWSDFRRACGRGAG